MIGNRGMDDLIPVVNKLQDAFSTLGRLCPLDLPQIAVVGSQSSGKSSVLESFVGRDFLPRGGESSWISMRFEKKLKLKWIVAQGSWFTLEGEKGVSSVPINLKIYSSHVLNLTLVDLPGLTKVAVKGQPTAIEKLIRDMIMEYIVRPNCLILAISPANSDLANSDALQLAREVDPSGTRTIGVITKLDLMDEGTDALDALENRLIPLRRGYVGVVNRSQKAIEERKSIDEARKEEKQFFENHPVYRHLAEKMGTIQLQRVLNQQLERHICASVPHIKSQLAKEVALLEKQVREFDQHDLSNNEKPAARLMQILQRFSYEYWGEINGFTSSSVNLESLSGGARINRIFFESFPYEISKYEMDEKRVINELSTLVLNVRGALSGISTPDYAFFKICERQIERFRAPSLYCAEATMNVLVELALSTSEKLSTYPRLREALESCLKKAIKSEHQRTIGQVNYYINCQKAYINVNHPEFLTDKRSYKTSTSDLKSNTTVRKGYMLLHSSGLGSSNKEYWFVLTVDTLSWFKDNKEQDRKHSVSTQGLKIRHPPKGLLKKLYKGQPSFELYYPSKKALYDNALSLQLSAHSQQQLDEWKAAFLRIGVLYEHDKKDDSQEDGPEHSFDPSLETHLDNLRCLLENYIQIESKSVKDHIPKLIMNFLINSMKRVLDSLYAEIVSEHPVSYLMEESVEEKRLREDTLNMYKLATDALKVLTEITRKTNLLSSADGASSESPPEPASPRKPPAPAPPKPPLPSQLPPEVSSTSSINVTELPRTPPNPPRETSAGASVNQKTEAEFTQKENTPTQEIDLTNTVPMRRTKMQSSTSIGDGGGGARKASSSGRSAILDRVCLFESFGQKNSPSLEKKVSNTEVLRPVSGTFPKIPPRPK
ncbi:dynamin-1-like isoform X2 [Zophobas morio]|uniref:dynamin-1-like isoform X2 n=1 Tax=Zophobas morio TaxID=2755281 RepID=UPI00308332BC